MKQFSLPKHDLDFMRREFKGATVVREGTNVAVAKVSGKPFVRVETDILNAVRVTVRVFCKGAWHKFYDYQYTLGESLASTIEDYNSRNDGTFDDLDAKARDKLMQADREFRMDHLLDMAVSAAGSALFSKTPVMELHVEGYPNCFGRAVLKHFKVDCTMADKQIAGLLDGECEPLAAAVKVK